jgi:hypothetical protein
MRATQRTSNVTERGCGICKESYELRVASLEMHIALDASSVRKTHQRTVTVISSLVTFYS